MAQVNQYNVVSRVLHWVSALVIIGMFAVGLWMVDLSYYSEWYRTAPHWHKSVGILIVATTLFRLLWNKVVKTPQIDGTPLIRMAAHLGHLALYALILVIGISGYLISTEDGRGIEVFDWFTVPGLGQLFEGQADLAGEIHFYAAWSLILLAAGHALAAIKHHVVDKDDTLRKMIGASK
ncbi:cytochrome b [Vibrio astriarenae]|jgi:cytochrome b561|uniref:Cytochrome b n=1 Tax=Vibrio agarivorans TaxID=153622 RepID=A0ABT7Y6K3_9VIBR|nr:cytochrome b [Vibrio agarivorans]MDN2483686.1 cytochrome b [Vibrio agarivorans]MDN3661000.1 cytochrome b [Vibrio agarivorans]